MNKIIHYKSKLAGRSLVELMIAITIGLFILIAVSALFLSNNQTSRATDDKSRLEDEGRLALNLIAFHLRMAGYGQLATADVNGDARASPTSFTLPPNSPPGSTINPVEGCTGSFTNPSAAVRTCAGNTQPDSVAIRYVVDIFNSNVNGTGAPAPTDCLGQRITAASSIVENRFFIRNNATTGRPELYCIGNGNTPDGADFTGAAQPIAENIIDLRLTYGTSSVAKQSVDGAFVDANNGGIGVVWGNVLAVNVCLVGQSANDGVAARPQQYRNCAGQLITATDRRLYSTFSTVVALRSKV